MNKENYKLYAMVHGNPNGTTDLLITDNCDQIIGCVENALTENHRLGDGFDSMGNLTVSMYGESIIYVDYSDVWDEDEGGDKLTVDLVMEGELSDLEPCVELDWFDLNEFKACSPVDPKGWGVLRKAFEIVKEAEGLSSPAKQKLPENVIELFSA
jgi:hypothetical protein